MINDTSSLIQLRGSRTDEGLAFSEDILRIKVVGDTELNLIGIDLPRLIIVLNKK